MVWSRSRKQFSPSDVVAWFEARGYPDAGPDEFLVFTRKGVTVQRKYRNGDAFVTKTTLGNKPILVSTLPARSTTSTWFLPPGAVLVVPGYKFTGDEEFVAEHLVSI
jgi:hypothetical protein